MLKINSCNEYDSLKTVILGSVYENNKIPQLYKDKEQEDFIKIVNQTNEELKNFEKILHEHNVKVLRPKQPENKNLIFKEPLINMRDFYMVYKNIFFSSNNPYIERRFQNYWMEEIINELITDGNLIVNANEINYETQKSKPEVILEKEYDTYFELVNVLKPNKNSHLKNFFKNLDKIGLEKLNWLINHDITNNNKNFFHTASILRHNDKCFISEYCGTEIGKKWILNWLKFLNINPVFVNNIGHLDNEICIVNENTIICLEKENCLTPYFENQIHINGTKDFYYKLPSEFNMEKFNPSLWLNKWQPLFKKNSKKSNCLSINKETLLLPFYDKEIYKNFKNLGINPIYIKWSNDIFWEGSLHCITCDIERRPE